MMRFRVLSVVVCVIVLLSACATTPTTPTQVQQVSDTSREPAVIATPNLPGRLLMAKAGDLWMWQNGNLQQITQSGNAWQPAFSRDGTRIVFVRRVESASDIMLTSASGGEAIQLTNNASNHPLHSFERIYDSTWAMYPSFSPDGNRIVYASQYGPPEGDPASEYRMIMYFMEARAGATREDAYADGSGNVGHAIFDVDGDGVYFAFAPAGQNGAPRIMRYQRSTGRLTIPAGMPDQTYDPALSPNGQTLYFAKRTATGTDIFALPVSGGTATPMTNLNSARAPAISPDGEWLVFLAVPAGSSGFEMYAQKLTQGQPDGDAVQMTRDQLFDADSGISWGN